MNSNSSLVWSSRLTAPNIYLSYLVIVLNYLCCWKDVKTQEHTNIYRRSRSGQTMPLSRHSEGTYRETSSHAACQGTFGHGRLSLLSHCGLILACRVELVCASQFRRYCLFSWKLLDSGQCDSTVWDWALWTRGPVISVAGWRFDSCQKWWTLSSSISCIEKKKNQNSHINTVTANVKVTCRTPSVQPCGSLKRLERKARSMYF